MRRRKRFYVTVLLGETEPTKQTFAFHTRAERLAFLEGLEAAIGYAEFELVKLGEKRHA